ncbi:MAG: hypothetical protein RL497_593 [Pseudomonadota bacterium]
MIVYSPFCACILKMLPRYVFRAGVLACAIALPVWAAETPPAASSLPSVSPSAPPATQSPSAVHAEKPKEAPPKDVSDALAQIDVLQQQLDALNSALNSELQTAKTNKAENLADIQQRYNLAQNFIFNPKTRQSLQQKTAQGQLKIQQNARPEALKLLSAVVAQYRQLIERFGLIEETITAQKRAELTRTDSKMYYKMRVRSTLPPKALKAYGIMELAKQQRDQGKFAEALAQWDQAEVLVRESFNEHIAAMTKWREDAIKNADIEREKSRVKVEALLKESMLIIPAGEFVMGSNQEGSDEAPARTVRIKSFKLNNTEVTHELYDLCIASSNCFYVPPDEGWGKGTRPVTNLSYYDITSQFLPWLNKLTGLEYRLPTEAEWEYAARAGTTSEYFWGDNTTCDQARFDGGNSSVCFTKEGKNSGTLPVKRFKPNAFGLFDMHGNVWEWVEDCWHPNYQGAPSDGSAWVEGNCDIRVMRGGAWDYPSNGMRSANRYYFAHKIRKNNYGFRLALSIKP